MAPIFLGIVSPELSKRRGTGINISPSDSQKKFLIASHLGSHSMQLRSTGFVINIDQHGEGGGYLYGILQSKTGPTYTVDSATSALTLHAYHTMQVQSTSPNLLH